MTFPKGGLEKNLYSGFIFSFLKKNVFYLLSLGHIVVLLLFFLNLLLLFKKKLKIWKL